MATDTEEPRPAANAYLIAGAAQAIGLLSAGVVTVVVARLLGPAGRGEYAVLSGVVQLLTMLGQLGFLAGAIQMGSRGAVPPGRLLRYAQLLPWITGAAGVALLTLLFWLAPAVLAHPTTSAWAVATIIVPLLLSGQLQAAILLALQRPTDFNRLYITQQLIWVAGAGVATAVWRVPAAALAGWLVSVVLWKWALVRRLGILVTRAQRADLSWRELGRVLAFGGQSTAGTALQLAASRLSLVVVAGLASKTEAGIYSVAAVLAETLWQAVTAACQVNLPRASAAYGRGERPDDVMLASRLASALTVGAALAVAIAAPLFVTPVFGPAFATVVTPLRILLFGTGWFGLCLLLSSDLLARGHPRFTALASAIVFAVTVTLTPILVPAWGSTGAALSACLGFVASTAVIAAIHHRLTHETAAFVLLRKDDLHVAWRVTSRTLRWRG